MTNVFSAISKRVQKTTGKIGRAQHWHQVTCFTMLESILKRSYNFLKVHSFRPSASTFVLLQVNMSYYARAREFQNSAITSAQEANNQALEAISWGRLSLGWIYGDHTRNALDCVQEAHRITASNNTLTKAWLAAIEAEVQANLHNRDACLRALDESEHFEDQHHLPEDNYLIHFDRSLLEGYQGVCFGKLYHPEDTQSAMYLEKAQIVLIDALARLDSSTILRQPTYLRDLADTHVKKGEIEEACERAIQAVTIASQVQLQKVVKRLFTLRQELEPWKDTQYVRSLDDHLAPLRMSNDSIKCGFNKPLSPKETRILLELIPHLLEWSFQ